MYLRKSIPTTWAQDKHFSVAVYRSGVFHISDPVSPAGHWQAAILVSKHMDQNHGFKPTDPEKLPEGLLPRSRHHRCDSEQLCLDVCNGEEQAPSGYNSFVLFSSD